MRVSERGVWVYRDGKLVDKFTAPPLHRKFADAPFVISDTMEPTWNPANGQRYDSKRAYERAVRAAGCEIIGNEKPKASPKPQASDPALDVKAAIEQIESRTPTQRRKRKRERV